MTEKGGIVPQKHTNMCCGACRKVKYTELKGKTFAQAVIKIASNLDKNIELIENDFYYHTIMPMLAFNYKIMNILKPFQTKEEWDLYFLGIKTEKKKEEIKINPRTRIINPKLEKKHLLLISSVGLIAGLGGILSTTTTNTYIIVLIFLLQCSIFTILCKKIGIIR